MFVSIDVSESIGLLESIEHNLDRHNGGELDKRDRGIICLINECVSKEVNFNFHEIRILSDNAMAQEP
jgi:hypothetical protein